MSWQYQLEPWGKNTEPSNRILWAGVSIIYKLHIGSVVSFVSTRATEVETTEVGLSGAGMLGRTGRCKSFDNSANGYARGEAVVACVFKKGQGAEDVENRVASFVSGFVNQDGRSASLTVSWPGSSCREFGSLAIECYCFVSDLHLEYRDVSAPCLITRESESCGYPKVFFSLP